MYIAFKWLLGLSFTMWVAICCLSYVRTHDRTQSPDYKIMKCHKEKHFTISSLKRRTNGSYTIGTKYIKLKNNIKKYKVIETAYLSYGMFVAASAVVAMMNQNSKLLYTLHKVRRINIKPHLKRIENCAYLCYLNLTAVASVAIREILSMFKKIGNISASHNIQTQSSCTAWVPMLLIKRLEDIVEEKNRLAHLLLATIQENKNLKTRSHIETVTKNKLMKLIEDSQTHLKDFKARLLNLQNINFITSQENISLKARVNKLTKQKLEMDQNLMALVKKIYELKDKELMSLCDNLALNEESLQNIEIIKEIRKLLQNSTPEPAEITEQFSDYKSSSSVATYLQPEILRDKGGRIVPFVSLKPKSKGHLGEYLWTVKDSDGLIERIYEYDNFDSDYDNGDMIRRIREYSVFCDKDCVLDRKSTRTITNERSDYLRPMIANQNFLTGSEAFQTFLRNNSRLVAGAVSPTQSPGRSTSLICG